MAKADLIKEAEELSEFIEELGLEFDPEMTVKQIEIVVDRAKEAKAARLAEVRTVAEKYSIGFTDNDSIKDIEAKIAKAKADGVIPDGEAPSEPKKAGATGSIGRAATPKQEPKYEDVEVSSMEEVMKYQADKRLVGFTGIDKETGKGFVRILAGFLLAIFVGAFGSINPAHAGLDGTEIAVHSNFDRDAGFKIDAQGDLVPITDSTNDIGELGTEVDDIFVDDITATTDLTFRSTLIATGRVNAALTLASSSTSISGSNVPYAIIRKNIGGAGNDNTGVGTELANGKPGSELVIEAVSIASGSSWVVTPSTMTGFTSLTFDAAGERVNLLYVDDTIGWIIRSSTATVNGTV